MTHPQRWRETCDPFSLPYHDFQPREILGYPHAGNDVFHVRGTVNNRETTAYVKVARQAGAALHNEVHILHQLNAPFFPKVLDYDWEGGHFSVTEALPGLRVSNIVGENEDFSSLAYMEAYGEALALLHKLKLDAPPQADRKFYHRPQKNLLEKLDLLHLDGFFENSPARREPVFCHGDFHYANVLWQEQRISAILDFELAGYGDRNFDIAWALFLRPGQKFLKSEKEQRLFLEGYGKSGEVDPHAVMYYMAQCYVYFLDICRDDAPYCAFIRDWLEKHCRPQQP